MYTDTPIYFSRTLNIHFIFFFLIFLFNFLFVLHILDLQLHVFLQSKYYIAFLVEFISYSFRQLTRNSFELI